MACPRLSNARSMLTNSSKFFFSRITLTGRSLLYSVRCYAFLAEHVTGPGPAPIEYTPSIVNPSTDAAVNSHERGNGTSTFCRSQAHLFMQGCENLKDQILGAWSVGSECTWPDCDSEARFKTKTSLKKLLNDIHVNPLLCQALHYDTTVRIVSRGPAKLAHRHKVLGRWDTWRGSCNPS